MTDNLQMISQQEARDSVLRSLGLAEGTSLGPPLVAEALRSALWANWILGEQPVYVTRLLNAASHILSPWHAVDSDSSTTDELLRQTLDELEIIGELVSLPGGRWAPTPMRTVSLPTVGRHVLLGGAPSGLLPSSLRVGVERSGVARLLRVIPRGLNMEMGVISEQDWLKVPTGELSEWASAVLRDSPLDTAGDIALNIYAPNASRGGSNQFDRWQTPSDRLANGLYLARSRLRRGTMAHYIGRITKGHVEAIGAPRLGAGDVRRLMYGLDMLAGNPVRMQALRQQESWRLKLGSALPKAEQRLLITIGREEPPPDGKYYPRRWVIKAVLWPKALQALQTLGMQVEER